MTCICCCEAAVYHHPTRWPSGRLLLPGRNAQTACAHYGLHLMPPLKRAPLWMHCCISRLGQRPAGSHARPRCVVAAGTAVPWIEMAVAAHVPTAGFGEVALGAMGGQTCLRSWRGRAWCACCVSCHARGAACARQRAAWWPVPLTALAVNDMEGPLLRCAVVKAEELAWSPGLWHAGQGAWPSEWPVGPASAAGAVSKEVSCEHITTG